MSDDMGKFIVLDLPHQLLFVIGDGFKPQLYGKVLKITLIACESLTSLDRGIFTEHPVYSGRLNFEFGKESSLFTNDADIRGDASGLSS